LNVHVTAPRFRLNVPLTLSSSVGLSTESINLARTQHNKLLRAISRSRK
jgi:hypothetical protein